MIKHCKTTLLLPLHEVICQCWQEGAVPQDTRDSKIITLYKNKGERNDCNNYRRISLLSIVGKVFARVILMRLQKLAERIYPESQCGLRAGRSTIDMIFSLRQLQEKCREQHMPLYIAFIDLTKSFDLVSRDGLFKVLPKIGCPPKLQSMIESFHTDTKGTVQFNGSSSEPFEIRNGVKQGCILAPTLFGIFFGLLLKHAFDTTTEGIYHRTRSDGRLFNLARLRAKTKVCEVLIRDMLFADDAAGVAHSRCGFSQACKDFGLAISLKKTNVLGQDTETPTVITIDDYELNAVCQFTYLGSTITDNQSLDAEIDKRIGQAASTLAHLTALVWTSPKLSVKTNMAVYSPVQGILLSRETMVCAAELYSLHCLCYQDIAAWQRDMDYTTDRREGSIHSTREASAVSWEYPGRTNADVLSRAGLPSMYNLLRKCRLRWLGHVRRMDDGRIPKYILYGELASHCSSVDKPQSVREDKHGSLQSSPRHPSVSGDTGLCRRVVQSTLPVLSGHCCMAARHGLHDGQERRLNTFHLRIIRRILGISWQDQR